MSNDNLKTTNQQTCDSTTSSQANKNSTTKQNSSSSTSSTSSRARARTREMEAKLTVSFGQTSSRARTREGMPELPPIERLHQTRELYEGNIGRMTPAIANMIERCLLAGMDPDVVDSAIAKTGWAKRPSPNYLAAILRRYCDQSIKTIDDLMKDEARFEAMKEQRRAERAARWYEEDTISQDLPF